MQQGARTDIVEISTMSQTQAADLLNVSREYEGHDPIGFVLSLNLKRRHLDTAQRAMVASRLATLDRGNPNFVSANTAIAAIAQPEAAKLLNVSEDSIQRARKVLDQGSEALIQKVDAGELAVSTAAKIAELPEEEQVEIVALGKEEIKKHVLAMKHTEISAPSQPEVVKLWIIKNQFGRRNISDFVRAELALQAEPLIAARAKERQELGINQYSPVANLPQAETGKTRDELSTMSGVSARNISKVKNILESGSEDLVTQVRSGNVSINAAETIATLPKEKQAKMVARGKKEI